VKRKPEHGSAPPDEVSPDDRTVASNWRSRKANKNLTQEFVGFSAKRHEDSARGGELVQPWLPFQFSPPLCRRGRMVLTINSPDSRIPYSVFRIPPFVTGSKSNSHRGLSLLPSIPGVFGDTGVPGVRISNG
jgi:hypothetical protein